MGKTETINVEKFAALIGKENAAIITEYANKKGISIADACVRISHYGDKLAAKEAARVAKPKAINPLGETKEDRIITFSDAVHFGRKPFLAALQTNHDDHVAERADALAQIHAATATGRAARAELAVKARAISKEMRETAIRVCPPAVKQYAENLKDERIKRVALIVATANQTEQLAAMVTA